MGILNDEQVEALRAMHPPEKKWKPLKDMTPAERREYGRVNKQQSRERVKTAKKRAESESIVDHWQRARNAFKANKPATLQSWLDRQDEVFDILNFAEGVMAGHVTRNDDDEERNLTIADVQTDLESIAVD